MTREDVNLFIWAVALFALIIMGVIAAMSGSLGLLLSALGLLVLAVIVPARGLVDRDRGRAAARPSAGEDTRAGHRAG